MAVLLACPACNSTLRVPEGPADRVFQCPKCRATLTVPHPAGASRDRELPGRASSMNSAATAWPAASADSPAMPPKPGAEGHSPVFWISLGAAAATTLVLLCLGVAVWLVVAAPATRNVPQAAARPAEPADSPPRVAPTPSAEPVSPMPQSAPLVVPEGQPDEAMTAAPLAPPAASQLNVPPPSLLQPAPAAQESAMPPIPPDGSELVQSALEAVRRPVGPAAPSNSANLGFWGLRHGLKFGVTKYVGDVEVVLGRKFSTVYIPRNAKTLVEGNMPMLGPVFPVGFRRRADDDFADPSAGLIPVDGKPEKVEYASSDPRVADLYSDGSGRFPNGGKVLVSVRIAGESLAVPLTVVEFPLSADMISREFRGDAATGEEVIRCLGFPDRKTPHFVQESQSREIDGIYYWTGKGGISVEHWEYDKYPGAVLSLAGHPSISWLWCVGTKPN